MAIIDNSIKDRNEWGGHSTPEREGLPKTLDNLFPNIYVTRSNNQLVTKSAKLFHGDTQNRVYLPILSEHNHDNIILDGYWFNYQNFDWVKQELLCWYFRPKDSVLEYIQSKYSWSGNQTNSIIIGIHLR